MTFRVPKSDIISNFAVFEGDSGSVYVQIALLTERIGYITDHLKVHKKDFSSRRGLLKLVGHRRRLMSYLKGIDPKGYVDLANKLGIKK